MAHFDRRLLLIPFGLVLLFCLAPPVQAQTCYQPCTPTKSWQGSGTEYHFDANVPDAWRSAFDSAANDWNTMHGSYDSAGPAMYINPGNGGIRVVVEYPVHFPGAIAEWDPADAVIRISPDWLSLTDDTKKFVALHEWGHQAGYADLYGCDGWSVMGQLGSNPPTAFTFEDSCGFNFYYDPICEAGGGEDYYNHCTPLVLSFGSGRPQFSKPRVLFDIAGNGHLPTTAWTQRPLEGFLTLDRNDDGSITSGRELFGNVTPYAPGMDGPKTFSGFNAVEFFDRPSNGGNGNGVIDPGDIVFDRLMVWFDKDQDGISRSDELFGLRTLGIEYIQLRGLAMNEVDNHGNILWFGTSFVYTSGGQRHVGSVVDVIFKVK